MNNISIVIPIVDTNIQDFSTLVNELQGNYVSQDIIETKIDENGEEVIEVIEETPYNSIPCPDYSGKIIFVSHSPVSTPEGVENVVVDGELNIAKLWNSGINHAIFNGASHIVILNEVSSINPHIFAEVVEKYSNPVINLSDGGCFIVTPEVQANESYRWWFADLDLFENNDTISYRNSFLDIVQDNSIPIQGIMKEITEVDIATRSQQ